MFGKSGKYLLLMTYWWILPFLAVALYQFSPWEHLPSYYVFFIPFIIAGIISLICGRIEAYTGWWSRAGFWKKYLILMGVYIVNIKLIFFVTVTLHDLRVLHYFGGDAEGSFALLYPYTIPFYLVMGLFLGIGRYARQAWRSRRQA
jgi:hypothetical protein